jgi:hypothetical protein
MCELTGYFPGFFALVIFQKARGEGIDENASASSFDNLRGIQPAGEDSHASDQIIIHTAMGTHTIVMPFCGSPLVEVGRSSSSSSKSD